MAGDVVRRLAAPFAGSVTARGFAASAGWASLALGLFLTAKPGTATDLMGLGDRPRLGQAVGAADLALAAGLLLRPGQGHWLVLRALGNLAIAGLCGNALANGSPRPARAATLLALMAPLATLEMLVARRLAHAAR